MEDYNWDIEEHLTYRRIWGCGERLPNLLRPHSRIWPNDPLRIKDYCDQLLEGTDKQSRFLTLSCCAASALLSARPYREKAFQWLRTKTLPGDIGLPFKSWRGISSWRWIRVHIPLLSPHTGKGVIIDVMLGMGDGEVSPPWTTWVEEVLDETAREAIARVAERVSQEQTDLKLFFWPIMGLHERTFITGKSLALSVYLGWKSLAAGLTAPPLAATGAISREDSLDVVEGITEKAIAASRHGLRGFLYPKGCSIDAHENLSIELIPVEDLSEAEALWRFYSPGTVASVIHATNRSAPLHSRLIYLTDIPIGLLKWLQKNKLCLEDMMREGLTDEGTAENFVTRLEQILVDLRCPLESIEFLLSSISPEMIEDVGSRRPDIAFRACEAGVVCFNHLGNSREAEKWSGRATSLIPLIAPMQGAEAKIFLLQNLGIVQAHNRFLFDPLVEQRLSNELVECLKHMEKELLYRRMTTPNAVSHDLGAFYGTISQNYGFCGPAYIYSFEGTIEKAMNAFGGGSVSGTAHNDWQRQHSYRVYAYLDAGRYDEAERALAEYLNCGAIHQYQPDNNSFRHAALMRFLAQTRHSSHEYFKWASRRLASVPGRHPWQLWLYNLGCLKEADENLMRAAWTRSASICLNQGGETLKVMALLPLSALYSNGLAGADYLEPRVEGILKTIETGVLNSRHFNLLLSARNWEDSLHITAEKAPTLFPFSYR